MITVSVFILKKSRVEIKWHFISGDSTKDDKRHIVFDGLVGVINKKNI